MNIVILGASKGVGKRLALELSKDHHILALARTTNVFDFFPNITEIQLDLSSYSSIKEALIAIKERGSSVDIIFNVAGGEYIGPISHIDDTYLSKDIDSYIKGQVLFFKNIIPLLTLNKSHIYNFSVLWAVDKSGNEAGNALFTTLKSSMVKFLDCLMSEQWEKGLAVTHLHLGELADPQQTVNDILSNEENFLNPSIMAHEEIIYLIRTIMNLKTIRLENLSVLPQDRAHGRTNIHFQGPDFDN